MKQLGSGPENPQSLPIFALAPITRPPLPHPIEPENERTPTSRNRARLSVEELEPRLPPSGIRLVAVPPPLPALAAAPELTDREFIQRSESFAAANATTVRRLSQAALDASQELRELRAAGADPVRIEAALVTVHLTDGRASQGTTLQRALRAVLDAATQPILKAALLRELFDQTQTQADQFLVSLRRMNVQFTQLPVGPERDALLLKIATTTGQHGETLRFLAEWKLTLERTEP